MTVYAKARYSTLCDNSKNAISIHTALCLGLFDHLILKNWLISHLLMNPSTLVVLWLILCIKIRQPNTDLLSMYCPVLLYVPLNCGIIAFSL